jgi:ribonuclease P/MRP protein subunit POP5
MVKTRIKPILPSLRKKKRYIAFEVVSKDKITDFGDVSKEIMRAAHDCLGRFSMADANIMLLANKWNPDSQRGILKVSHTKVDAVKASFVFANKIGSKDAIIRSLGVSGILKKAENNYIKN